MSGNCHDRAVARLGLGKLGDSVMAKVMEAQPGQRTLDVVNICAAVAVAAHVARILEQAARRALDGGRYAQFRFFAKTRIRLSANVNQR